MNIQLLLSLAKSLAAHRGLKLSTVSTYAAKDGKFFKSLEAGRGCTLSKAERVVGYFDENWPSDLEWPKGVARPSLSKRRAA